MTPALSSPIEPIREASRRLVRELGFLKTTLAGTDLPPSAVHAIVEIGARQGVTAGELSEILALEKSSVSRMLRKLVEAGEIKEAADARDGRMKALGLTRKGRATLAKIDRFAKDQVVRAMDRLASGQRQIVADGLRLYAGALGADRKGAKVEPAIAIEAGYRPGAIARCVEMHALYYARAAGFGLIFEAQVATGMAEFCARLNRPCNQLWLASHGDRVVGSVAIDGEDLVQDLGPNVAHLRWFIVDDTLRGAGIGGRLLSEALAFCDGHGFAETHLWTFQGLDAARRLYEAHGFRLVEERPGSQWGKEVMEQRFVRQVGS